ncbi:MAG: hypothetical protein IGR93_11395 [Hydrococcus sp. C42_A2020_068]|nr:hypothetical protein [Pleurocapsa sp. PCC 7327]MBF2020679.1 hypothetical protein [Hydrococcus sp. C42_A2020_068]
MSTCRRDRVVKCLSPSGMRSRDDFDPFIFLFVMTSDFNRAIGRTIVLD